MKRYLQIPFSLRATILAIIACAGGFFIGFNPFGPDRAEYEAIEARASSLAKSKADLERLVTARPDLVKRLEEVQNEMDEMAIPIADDVKPMMLRDAALAARRSGLRLKSFQPVGSSSLQVVTMGELQRAPAFLKSLSAAGWRYRVEKFSWTESNKERFHMTWSLSSTVRQTISSAH